MRSLHISFALAGLVILSVGIAVPAQSATEDKQSVIERLQNDKLTPEEEAETAAMLAEEQDRIAYGAIAVPAISPGHGIAEDGSVIVRVYPGADIDAVEADLAREDLKASVQLSRYMPAEKDALEAALTGIQLEDDEAFGFAYDAIKDIVSVSGSVPASKVEAAVGHRLPYEFSYGDAGRVSR
jgi:hypothetical protein